MSESHSLAELSLEEREELIKEWSALKKPQSLLRKVFETLGSSVAIGTSGQLSGVTLIDMAAKTGLPFRVFCVDTLRLHESTYELWEHLEQYYGIELEIYRAEDSQIERMISQHGEHLFFDNRFKQEHCCNVRKVVPHREALKSMVAWISGLRRDQSETRSALPRCSEAEYENRSLLKVSPLIEWDEEDVWAYVRKHDVPYDPLFDPRDDGSRYPSVGCVICTTPILPHEDTRAGRWRWFNDSEESHKKECGIHFDAVKG